MKKKYFLILAATLTVIAACNNAPESTSQVEPTAPKTREDSLFHDIMMAHDAAMPKIGKLKSYQSLVTKQLDSLSGLPAKEQINAAGYKEQMTALLDSLQYADMAMDKWMTEFVPDSASNDPAMRIKYLENEREKAMKMRDHVLASVERAKEMLHQ